MSINRTVVHTFEVLVAKSDKTETLFIQAKTLGEARGKAKAQKGVIKILNAKKQCT